MDRLLAMQMLVRVVEAGSFSAVAKESGVSQSALSKQIAALERTLGAQLLVRTTRALKLTEAGERYFEQVRRLVAEIAEAESTLRAGEHQLQGWLRVAAAVGYGRLRLMPLVKEFLALHPAVKIDLRLDDRFVDLVEQGIDVAVRIGVLRDSGLIARRVGATRRAVVASREYLSRLPDGLTLPTLPTELTQHNCVVYSEPRSPNEWTFIAGPGANMPVGHRETVNVTGNLQTNSSEGVRASVLAGIGLGYAPAYLFDDELATGEVIALMPCWGVQDLPINAVSPPQRRQSLKVRAFTDFLAKYLTTIGDTGGLPIAEQIGDRL